MQFFVLFAVENQEVLMLQPSTAKDFQIRSLADRIADYHHLHYLYPDIPKDVAFGKYYTPYQGMFPNNFYNCVITVHVIFIQKVSQRVLVMLGLYW